MLLLMNAIEKTMEGIRDFSSPVCISTLHDLISEKAYSSPSNSDKLVRRTLVDYDHGFDDVVVVDHGCDVKGDDAHTDHVGVVPGANISCFMSSSVKVLKSGDSIFGELKATIRMG
ncbi:hypothetical protein L2E82_51332 [Cichorium intybus]|nr:hypothetical protein L2E82_51332 [Cichorium intybus]